MPFLPTKTNPYNLSGRSSQRPEITEKEARATAVSVLKNTTTSPLALQTVEALTIAGVLTIHQLQTLTNVSTRSLKRYHHRHFIDYLMAPHQLQRYDFTNTATKQLRLCTLGAVGQAIARHRGQTVSSYTAYGINQITHDVLGNQMVIDLLQHGRTAGYEPVWYNKYEARVYKVKEDKRVCVLEPDALLAFRKDGRLHHTFIMEYHNEDNQNRAKAKVEHYEEQVRHFYWRNAWQLETFPLVLVGFTKKAVATGYKAAMKPDLRCRYLGKQFHANDEQPGQWWDFQTKTWIDIFEE